MNIPTLTNGTKKFVVGLLAISTTCLVTVPVRADNAVVQESIQQSVNTGNGNTSVQNSFQESSIDRTSRRGRNSEAVNNGVIQRNDQFCDNLGDDNFCGQNTEQRSNIRQRSRR